MTQYTYDAHGQRLIKVGSTTGTTIYQYDRAGHLLEESDSQGNAQVDYVYLYGRPVATIQLSNNKIYFLHGDRLGSPQIATDGTQAVAWSTGYQPFGQIDAAPATITQDLRLPGQESDLETGLYHNGFRDYVPGWGRYLESDPVGVIGGLNTYAYAAGNPLRYVDPQGLRPLPNIPGLAEMSASDLEANTYDAAEGASLAGAWTSVATDGGEYGRFVLSSIDSLTSGATVVLDAIVEGARARAG